MMNTKTRGFCLLLFPRSSLWKSQLSAEQTVHMGSHNRPAADLSILPAAHHWSKFSCTEITNVWLKFVKVCSKLAVPLSSSRPGIFWLLFWEMSKSCNNSHTGNLSHTADDFYIYIYILYAEIRCIPFHSYLLLVCCLLRNSCHSAHREGKYNPVVALHQFRFTKCDKSLWWCLSSRLLAVCFSIKTQSCCISAAVISLRLSDHSRLLCFLLF